MHVTFKRRTAATLLALAMLAAGCGGQSGDTSQAGASGNQAGSSQPANEQVDQAVQAVLKQYKLPGAAVIRPAGQPGRLRITLTSGLPENPPPELDARVVRLMSDSGSDAERVAAITAVALRHAPGTAFESTASP